MRPAERDDYVARLRRADPDRLYMALLAPKPARERLIGLYAFNLELAAARERVSEPMIGRMRLQWWRDALTEARQGGSRAHPLTQSLAEWMPGDTSDTGDTGDTGSAGDGDTGFALALALVDAREADMTDQPFRTLAELQDYAEATSSGLIRLALLAGGVAHGPAHRMAAPVGRAYALAGILRAQPYFNAQGRRMLPAELPARQGDAGDSAASGAASDRLAALASVAAAAEADLERAGRITKLPPAARHALLPAALARLYLRRMIRTGFDYADPALNPGRATRILTLLRAQHFG